MHQQLIAIHRQQLFLRAPILASMKIPVTIVAQFLAIIPITVLAASPNPAPAQPEASAATTNQVVRPDSRYGLFDGLNRRSWYSQGDFPEPFLVDDAGLEINEARLDWLRTGAGPQHSDAVTAEVEKGFGLLTLEIEVPYERDASPSGIAQGVGNIDLGARYPFYQFVSANDFFDLTLGAALEIGVPVNSSVSKNTELVPKVFNDLKIGEHFTLQSIYGYSMLFGGGDDGGVQTFEYGFDFGYAIQHDELPIPGVQQFIPMFELVGQTGLNKDDAGQNSLLGNACFRLNLKSIGRVQPRLGFGFIFPLNATAYAETHYGIVTSLVFEY